MRTFTYTPKIARLLLIENVSKIAYGDVLLTPLLGRQVLAVNTVIPFFN
jgi:hypothetical protein